MNQNTKSFLSILFAFLYVFYLGNANLYGSISESASASCCISEQDVCCDNCNTDIGSCCQDGVCCGFVETRVPSSLQVSSSIEIKRYTKAEKNLAAICNEFLKQVHFQNNIVGNQDLPKYFQNSFLYTSRRLALFSIWRC